MSVVMALSIQQAQRLPICKVSWSFFSSLYQVIQLHLAQFQENSNFSSQGCRVRRVGEKLQTSVWSVIARYQRKRLTASGGSEVDSALQLGAGSFLRLQSSSGMRQEQGTGQRPARAAGSRSTTA